VAVGYVNRLHILFRDPSGWPFSRRVDLQRGLALYLHVEVIWLPEQRVLKRFVDRRPIRTTACAISVVIALRRPIALLAQPTAGGR
jgi:hypothetical protein